MFSVKRQSNDVEFTVTFKKTDGAIGFLNNIAAQVANPSGTNTAVWPDSLKLMLPTLFPGFRPGNVNPPPQPGNVKSTLPKNQYNPHKVG